MCMVIDICFYFLYSNTDMWIGINDRATENDFRNMLNQAVHLTSWASGEPNNRDSGRDGDCIRITGGQLRDSDCLRELQSICSKELEGNVLYAR